MDAVFNNYVDWVDGVDWELKDWAILLIVMLWDGKKAVYQQLLAALMDDVQWPLFEHGWLAGMFI